jgi:hypothetical protein
MGQFVKSRRFSKPRFTAWCSESISYVRMRCPTMVQKTPIRQHLCNYCATQNFNGLSYRCTRITSANDRASYGSAISGALPGSGHTSQHKRVSQYRFSRRRRRPICMPSFFGITLRQEILQPRRRFPQVRYQGLGPEDGSRVEAPAHSLSALREPVRCLREKLKWGWMLSKGIMEYFKLRRPWLISLWSELLVVTPAYRSLFAVRLPALSTVYVAPSSVTPPFAWVTLSSRERLSCSPCLAASGWCGGSAHHTPARTSPCHKPLAASASASGSACRTRSCRSLSPGP